MTFGTFLLRVDGIRDVNINDLKYACEIGMKTYQPEGQKYLYVINMEIIEDRFFWLSCDYDDAVSFRNYVVNQKTGKTEPNPRSKNQVEPKKQFFACYDTKTNMLYINDISRRNTLTNYLIEMTHKEYSIKSVYSSVDDFCNHIRSIRELRYTQVRNLYTQNSRIFKQVSDIWGMDTPEKIQMKIAYGDVPIHKGRPIIDRLARDRSEFENIIVIGCDDAGIERSFDYSTVIKRIQIHPIKDENEHYDPDEVRMLLLRELR